MRTAWLPVSVMSTLILSTTALNFRLAGRNLDLFMPNAGDGAGCPPLRPEGCECERFSGRDSGKYFQCATDPFCERCAEHWE